MSQIKVALTGSEGRMGKEIQSLINLSSDFKLVYQIDRDTNHNLENIDPEGVDIFIDFSLPELYSKVISFCSKHSINLVSGTTGIDDKINKQMEEAANSTGVFWAPNMSIGIAVLNEAIKLYANIESDFDFQIEEFHHNKKKDNPSGTALFLQSTLKESLDGPIPDPLGIRGGGIFGVHKVWAMSDEEVLNFEHAALNRQVFAKGALRAAKWMSQQSAGLYAMRDLLKVTY